MTWKITKPDQTHVFKCSNKSNLRRSFKQSSFFFKRSFTSPDMSTEYGHAISFKKPLISSWKLSRSSPPLTKKNHKTFTGCHIIWYYKIYHLFILILHSILNFLFDIKSLHVWLHSLSKENQTISIFKVTFNSET